jgi:hypothetical protein
VQQAVRYVKCQFSLAGMTAQICFSDGHFAVDDQFEYFCFSFVVGQIEA